MKSSWGRGRKGELCICYFGTYSMEEGYPRNRVIIDGLKKNGVDVVECHEDLWQGTSEKLEGIKDGLAVLKKSLHIIKAYLSLIKKFKNAGNYDALIVGYAGHIDIFLAKVLNLFRKKPLIFDAFLSLYDTVVMDRKIVSQNSLKAKFLWLIDRWSCRVADGVLLDTQAHVDYFVREFRLPAEKFYAIPVGSSLALQPLSPTSSNSPLSQRGDRGDLNVLYFGSYIPLHGVDVILKAAKIIQDKGNGLPSVIPAQAGIQNAGRGLDSHSPLKACGDKLRGNDDVVGNCSDDKKIVFILIGTGQLLPAMKELTSRLELKNIIFIDRFVREEELMGYIMEADICLGVFGQTEKASRVIPCKVYNCLAMGKPLVTMSSPAMGGILTHTENAYLCNPGDPEALADAVITLKNDKVLRENIGKSGKEFFERNFSTVVIGRRILDIVEGVICCR